MKSLEDLLAECGLQRYKPPKFFPSSGLTSGKTNRKEPYVIARRWFGVYLLQQERFEGHSTVRVTDESKGYSKIISRATGLDKHEADRMYLHACEVMKAKG